MPQQNLLNTTNSDLDFFEEVARLLVVTADPILEYRLHYNDTGDIISCSMQSHPDTDQYIVTDKETYDLYFRYRVKNNKLEIIKHDDGLLKPLIKSNKGFAVVKNHAALLLTATDTYTNIEYYDRNN